MTRYLKLAAALAALFVLTAAPAAAAGPLFAQKSVVARYWDGFKDYWGGSFKSQSAVTMVVLGTGVLGLFIITRGKWKK